MNLVDQIKVKEQEVKLAANKAWKKESENKMKIFKAVEMFLRPVLDEKDFINGETYFRIERSHPDYSYLKEMFTLQVDNRWSEEWEVKLNYYTGGATDEDWELSRLETLGRVAHLVRTKKDELIKTLEGLDFHKNIYREKYQLEGELNLLKTQVKEQEKVKVTNLILSGQKIEFDKPEWVVLGFSDDQKVYSIKVIDKTASGKTITVEMEDKNWRGEIYTFTRKVRTSTFITPNLIDAVKNTPVKELA